MIEVSTKKLVYDLFPIDRFPFLTTEYFGNSLAEYLVAFFIFVAIWMAIIVFRTIILVRLQSLVEKTRTKYDNRLVEGLSAISHFFYVFLSVFLTVKTLHLSETINHIFDALFVILIVYEAARFFQILVEIAFFKTSSTKDQTMLNALRLVTGIVVWVIGILLILSNFGFDITALAASLGIGGIAIALAAQNILGDLFSSFSIYMDKPFQIDDFIIIGSDMGTVKKIGLKTTRIETLRGEELIISNQELTSTRVLNFKRMKKRRIVFSIGVEYSTPTNKLEKIPGIIKQIIEKAPLADFDRAHFLKFGDFSLIFEVVYYVASAEYNDYMDTQQEINLSIKKSFEKEEIIMAFPTQTLFVQQEKTTA